MKDRTGEILNMKASFSMRMYKLWCYKNGYPEGQFKSLYAWANDKLREDL